MINNYFSVFFLKYTKVGIAIAEMQRTTDKIIIWLLSPVFGAPSSEVDSDWSDDGLPFALSAVSLVAPLVASLLSKPPFG